VGYEGRYHFSAGYLWRNVQLWNCQFAVERVTAFEFAANSERKVDMTVRLCHGGWGYPVERCIV
jgi:hypothetical protein